MAVSGGGRNSKPVPGDPSNLFIERGPMNAVIPDEPQCSSRNWYFSREEIEKHSPSRRDGIDAKKESQLRRSYCSFLRELGIKLKVPQVTIAAAMILCHRFYVRQSHMRNDWQTIATVSMFLACKVEETPRSLRDLTVVAYDLMYKWDSSASRRIRLKEVYEKQKELILIGERLLLATIAFDMDIQLPYKPLVAALKNLGLYSELSKIAWNFVNDWLCTTLCLQYKPHYIAAGCVYLAAKFQKVKLPSSNGKVWWMEFDISPMKLQEVIQQMLSLLERDRKQAPAPKDKMLTYSAPVAVQAWNSSQQSCVTSGSSSSSDGQKIDATGTHESKIPDCGDIEKCTLNSFTENTGLKCQTSSASSGISALEEDNSIVQPSGISALEEDNSIVQPKIEQVQSSSSKARFINGIDISRIRELRSKKRGNPSNNLVENMNLEIDSEAWVERQIEMGIQVGDSSFTKKQRKE